MNPTLQIENLSVTYRSGGRHLEAVRGVSLAIARGQSLGIVGESGSGKSTIALAVMGLLPSNADCSGRVLFDGVDLLTLDSDAMRKYRGRRLGMVFQAAMNALDPVMRVGRQIAEPLTAHGILSEREAESHARKLLATVGLPPAVADRFPHQLSGGMRQRAVIAMALACNPDVLVADEPTTALDVVAQTRIVSRLKRIQQDSGMALLYITHDMGLVSHVADEVAVMYEGEVVEQAPTRSIFIEPRHPYTRALIDSIPRVSGPKIALAAANHGYMNKGASAEAGCRYAFRCPRATAQCRDAAPPITQNNGTSFRCWNPLETG